MKKQLLFLALIVMTTSVQAKTNDPAEIMQNLKTEFEPQVLAAYDNLEKVLNASNQQIDLRTQDYATLVKNLQKYAGQGYTGAVIKMSTLAEKIFDTIKDTYKALANAKIANYKGETMRSQNSYDFLDHVLFLIKLHNANIK